MGAADDHIHDDDNNIKSIYSGRNIYQTVRRITFILDLSPIFFMIGFTKFHNRAALLALPQHRAF